MAVPFELWREACACAGANRARQQMAETGTEPPRFRDVRERQQRDSQARREAFQAARRAAAGKSRDEIRELYVTELRSRGLEPPTEPFLAATVEHIAGNPVPAARLVGQGFARVGRGMAPPFADPRGDTPAPFLLADPDPCDGDHVAATTGPGCTGV